MADNITDNQTDVIVLGAGIVGVSTAYAARQRGLSVILIDRREPGSETSYGNAGILSSGSISPLNNPSLWNALPKYLTNRHPALRSSMRPVGETRPEHFKEKCIRTGWPGTETSTATAPPPHP